MRVNGKKLKRARDEKLLTAAQLAELSGVSRDTISRAENSKTGIRQTSIKKMARVLGVDPKELICLE
jgi:transcriptional regulator with XRE-family HTH domain